MSKLHKGEKQDRKILKAYLKEQGGSIHADSTMGVTVVLAPSVRGGKHHFYRLSVAYQSPYDKWNRKRGEFVALTAWNSGKSIPIPAHEVTGTLNRILYGV